jgi:hypothetical protein
VSRTDSAVNNAHPNECEQDNTGEHVFSARDEREGDQNHGKNQAGGHRASDDQPDPALLRPRRAFG